MRVVSPGTELLSCTAVGMWARAAAFTMGKLA